MKKTAWGVQLLVKNPHLIFQTRRKRQLERLYLTGLCRKAALRTLNTHSQGFCRVRGRAVLPGSQAPLSGPDPSMFTFLAQVLSLLGLLIPGLWPTASSVASAKTYYFGVRRETPRTLFLALTRYPLPSSPSLTVSPPHPPTPEFSTPGSVKPAEPFKVTGILNNEPFPPH